MIAKEIAEKIYKAADEKKASEIVVLDMQGVAEVTDYYVICSANTGVQVRAIVDNIDVKLSEEGIFSKTKEGYNEGNWVLLDYGSCVVHVFKEEDRSYYNLEKLWTKAARIEMGE